GQCASASLRAGAPHGQAVEAACVDSSLRRSSRTRAAINGTSSSSRAESYGRLLSAEPCNPALLTNRPTDIRGAGELHGIKSSGPEPQPALPAVTGMVRPCRTDDDEGSPLGRSEKGDAGAIASWRLSSR